MSFLVFFVIVSLPNFVVCLPKVLNLPENIYIPSKTQSGTVIYQLEVEDLCECELYCFKTNNSYISFDLNPTLNKSVYSLELITDRIFTNLHSLSISFDLVNELSETLEIRMTLIFSNCPQNKKLFAPKLLRVSESAFSGTQITSFSVKSFQNRTNVLLTNSKHFKIQTNYLENDYIECNIFIADPLDYEVQTIHQITFKVSNPEIEPKCDTRNIITSTIVLSVVDEQDSAPVFLNAPPLTHLKTSHKVGEKILRIRVRDGDLGRPVGINLQLTYKVTANIFTVNQETGDLFLNTNLYEIPPNLIEFNTMVRMTVTAKEISETPLSTKTEMAFIVPYLPPKFTLQNYITNLNENAQIGTRLNLSKTILQIMPPRIVLLELQNHNNTFRILPKVLTETSSFYIEVNNSILIDYEQIQSLNCKIIARDLHGTQTEANLTVFINNLSDNLPVFTNKLYRNTLSENSPIGTIVTTIQAIDPDGFQLKYSLSGPTSAFFTINPITGLITIANSSGIDAESSLARILIEKHEYYESTLILFDLKVVAEKENGLKTSTNLELNIQDVNDNVPLCDRELYDFILHMDRISFNDNAIHVLDNDITSTNNQTYYQILKGNEDGRYAVNRDGLLFMSGKYHSDQPTDLRILVYDNGIPVLKSECTIRIHPRGFTIPYRLPGPNYSKKQIERILFLVTRAKFSLLSTKSIQENGKLYTVGTIAMLPFYPEYNMEEIHTELMELLPVLDEPGQNWVILLSISGVLLVFSLAMAVCAFGKTCLIHQQIVKRQQQAHITRNKRKLKKKVLDKRRLRVNRASTISDTVVRKLELQRDSDGDNSVQEIHL